MFRLIIEILGPLVVFLLVMLILTILPWFLDLDKTVKIIVSFIFGSILIIVLSAIIFFSIKEFFNEKTEQQNPWEH